MQRECLDEHDMQLISVRSVRVPACLRISALVRDQADPDQNPVPCTYVTVVT